MMESQDLLEYVIAISRRMAETRHLDALLPFVMDEVLHLVKAEHGYIVLMEGDGQLDFKARQHQAGNWHGDDEMSRSILRVVVESGEPLVLGNAMMDPRFAEAKSVLAYNLRSVMCVPLITQERIIGAIYVENRSIEGLFRPEDVMPLRLFANQAAASIENARLYGNLEGLVAVRTQELEEAKGRAEAASRAKSVFLTNMSHELRTPLNSILGYAQILQGQLDNRAMLKDGLATMYGSGRHLLTLIEDVLDIARIEANKLVLSPAAVNLSNFLNEIVNMMQLAAQEKGLELVYECSPELPQSVVVDARRLRQVLLNLLGNGVKFTDNGRVTLRVGRAGGEREKEALRFEVADTGMGIDPAELEKIFAPFEQGSGNRMGGMGLGLAISQQIVGLMGGRIEAKSVPGEGSRFWFTILAPAGGEVGAEDMVEEKMGCAGAAAAWEIQETGESAPMTPPPPAVLTRLYQLARLGDITGLQKQIQQLTMESEQYHAFGGRIAELAGAYDFRRILLFLEGYLDGTNERPANDSDC